MFKSRFIGSHYDAGYEYGSMLFKLGINPLDKIPLSEERVEYTKNTLGVYEKYYPEILEEIEGISDGLNIDSMDMKTFLISMYALTEDNFCSALAINQDGRILFGRNSDFNIEVGKLSDSVYYDLKEGYKFIGNTTAWTQMEDGINEHGLAVGLTFIKSKKIKPGFNSGILVRYILEKCKTTKEAIEFLTKVEIGSSQTVTLVDRTGDMAVVESNAYDMEIMRPVKDNNYIFSVNHFRSEKMKKYNWDLPIARSDEREKTLSETFKRMENITVEDIKRLLSGKFGFICQYDRSTGIDTVWSSIYDLRDKKILICQGNPMREEYRIDTRLEFK